MAEILEHVDRAHRDEGVVVNDKDPHCRNVFGILDGDLIAVDRAGKRRHGRIVVAVVDGAITVKKLAKRDGVWFLDPRARADGYATIPVTETTEIWGVVAGVVRRLPIE